MPQYLPSPKMPSVPTPSKALANKKSLWCLLLFLVFQSCIEILNCAVLWLPFRSVHMLANSGLKKKGGGRTASLIRCCSLEERHYDPVWSTPGAHMQDNEVVEYTVSLHIAGGTFLQWIFFHIKTLYANRKLTEQREKFHLLCVFTVIIFYLPRDIFFSIAEHFNIQSSVRLCLQSKLVKLALPIQVSAAPFSFNCEPGVRCWEDEKHLCWVPCSLVACLEESWPIYQFLISNTSIPSACISHMALNLSPIME